MKMLVDVLINKKRTGERPDRELAKTFLKSSFVFKTIETVLFVFANVKIET